MPQRRFVEAHFGARWHLSWTCRRPAINLNHATVSAAGGSAWVSRGGCGLNRHRYNSSTLLIEDSPISIGLIQSLREQSINVTTYKPDTDKRARLIAQTDLFAGGSVRVPRRAGWLEEFVAELLAFPGRHDVQVTLLPKA